jgi:hypothetical protein
MRGVSRPSTWMSASQVMLQVKAFIMSASVMLGSSLCFLEKRSMYSQSILLVLCLHCAGLMSSQVGSMYLGSDR